MEETRRPHEADDGTMANAYDIHTNTINNRMTARLRIAINEQDMISLGRLADDGSYNNSRLMEGMTATRIMMDDGRGMNDHTIDNSRRRLKGRHYSDGCQFIDGLERMEGGGQEDSIMTSTSQPMKTMKMFPTANRPRRKRVQGTIANPPHGFDH